MPESVQGEISSILAGDREAAAWLFDTFSPRLLRRLGQRFGSIRGLDREDLLQDTFLHLLAENGRVLARFLARTEGEDASAEALEQFLWSTACGIASNRRRSVLRHPTASMAGHEEFFPFRGEEGRSLARDALERLANCILQINTRLCLYFQLRFLEGLKPSEIAQATGWSRKATYKLKKHLEGALETCLTALGIAS